MKEGSALGGEIDGYGVEERAKRATRIMAVPNRGTGHEKREHGSHRRKFIVNHHCCSVGTNTGQKDVAEHFYWVFFYDSYIVVLAEF
jgi:hypothetical protein